MRCSSCEAQLDEFVDATLPPQRMNAVAAHLSGCTACEALHRRLRVVDALLETARRPVLEADFTFDVMAAVRTLPAPAVVRRPILTMAAYYLVAAWMFVGAVVSFAWPGGAPALARAGLHVAGGGLLAIEQGMQAMWPVAPLALPVVVSVLCVDLLLFAIVVSFYRTIRPRLNARLAAARVAVEADGR